jgi:hypothetical protein
MHLRAAHKLVHIAVAAAGIGLAAWLASRFATSEFVY